METTVEKTPEETIQEMIQRDRYGRQNSKIVSAFIMCRTVF